MKQMLHKLGRLMQFVGLVILPIAIAGNVAEKMALWPSLTLSAAGITIFYFGWLLQQDGPRG